MYLQESGLTGSMATGLQGYGPVVAADAANALPPAPALSDDLGLVLYTEQAAAPTSTKMRPGLAQQAI